MRFDVVVFDFDGTLVDSAAAKYRAFFELFADTAAHRDVVRAVLAADPDGSRHVVIPRMVNELTKLGLSLPQLDPVAAYGLAATRAMRAAPEYPGASDMLNRLKERMQVYISSAAPREIILSEAETRGWSSWLSGIHGYPEKKAEVVRAIIEREGIKPDRLAVVGDGISDAEAARLNNCPFFKITEPADLARAGQQLELDDV